MIFGVLQLEKKEQNVQGLEVHCAKENSSYLKNMYM